MVNKIIKPISELHFDYKGVYVKPDNSKHNVFNVFLQKEQTVNFYDFDTHKHLSIDLNIVNKLGVIEGLPQTEF